jgi:hypothetical protein
MALRLAPPTAPDQELEVLVQRGVVDHETQGALAAVDLREDAVELRARCQRLENDVLLLQLVVDQRVQHPVAIGDLFEDALQGRQ